jgi:hypothetical protein
MKQLINNIHTLIESLGTDAIDYNNEIDDRFTYNVKGSYQDIEFSFDAHDYGKFHVENLYFLENEYLPNVIEKLNNTNFKF